MADPLELIERWLEGFNDRDEERLLAVAHPDIVLRPMRWVPHAEYRGHAGVRAWLADMLASGNDATVTPDTVRSLGEGRVAVEGVLDDLALRFVGIYEIRDDRIAAVRAYLSDPELLAQLGILEPGEPQRSP